MKSADAPTSSTLLAAAAARTPNILKTKASTSYSAEARFLSDGEALRRRIEKIQLKKPDVIERKIGAFMKKHPRVARFYKAEHNEPTLHLIRNDEKRVDGREISIRKPSEPDAEQERVYALLGIN